jgi:hypothetical protein
MRLFAVLLAIGAWSQSAIARTPECKSISDPGARLTCYDKARPPVAPSASAKPLSLGVPDSKVDTAKHVDSIGAEHALDECAAKKYQPRLLST